VPIIHVKEVTSLWEKSQGLLGSKKPHPLLLRTRFGIHTFGMKFPIDVIILDKENRVVALRKNVKPNRLYFWNPMYNTVLELPLGTIEEKKILLQTSVEIEIDLT